MTYDLENTIDFYISSKHTNDFLIKYLRRCKYSLLRINILNKIFDLADPKLMYEAINNTYIYLEEVKNDRYYLKVIKKLIDKSYKVGISEFEEDFLALIVCLEIKDKHIIDLENYYIEKITSQVNNHGYPQKQEDVRIDEYNGKIETLLLRLSNNSLDNNN